MPCITIPSCPTAWLPNCGVSWARRIWFRLSRPWCSKTSRNSTLPAYPLPISVKVTPAANAMYNDPELTNRLVAKLRGVLGQANVVQVEPTMVFEDFAEFNLAGIPSADFCEGDACCECHV